MIRALAQLQKVDDVQIKLEMHLSVAEARGLLKSLSDEWPAWDFRRVLVDVLHKTVERVESAQSA